MLEKKEASEKAIHIGKLHRVFLKAKRRTSLRSEWPTVPSAILPEVRKIRNS